MLTNLVFVIIMTAKTKKTNSTEIVATEISMPASDMGKDLKNAILIVSLVANLIILTTWIALQVTTRYDYQLATFIFG